MTEAKQLVDALVQGLTARLAFREQLLIDKVQDVIRKARMTGNLGSSRLRFAAANPFVHEARERAELASNYLKQARISWSARQLVEAESEIRSAVMELFGQNLQEAAILVAGIGAKLRAPDAIESGGQDAAAKNYWSALAATGRWATIGPLFQQETDTASRHAAAIVHATLAEIMQSARTEMLAKSPEDRSPFMITNNFAGAVAAVAQGSASIGLVTQINSQGNRDQLTELAAIITAARTELGSEGEKQTAAALEVVRAEAESDAPDWGAVKAMALRVYGFMERAGSSAAGGALLAYARGHGWVP
jgi:hypothetical protein